MDESRPSIDQIFCDAIDLPPDQRAAFLNRECADDQQRAEVASLLAVHEKAGGFLHITDADRQDTTDTTDAPSIIGQSLGSYRITALIGAGGMGAVYEAQRADSQFRKQVAVKLIKRGMDSEAILHRFHRERQVLADLEHPGIARLIDGGMTGDGRPFLVMEYVDGRPIDRYCDEHQLSIRQRLTLFQFVCEAVQFAHRNLIVHRDIKPGNIYVTIGGAVKLLDFGVAKMLRNGDKATDVTVPTEQFITPGYASPEQIQGHRVSTATDVYSLGVVLFQLLTGRSPYTLPSSARQDLERVICHEPPTRPSTALSRGSAPTDKDSNDSDPESIARNRGTDVRRLQRLLTGDLDRIVLMALRKEPERRYASVEQFAQDIRRYLDGLPVIARPDTLAYRAAKFARRNAAAVLSLTILVLGLAAATTVSTWMYVRAERSRHAADQINVFLQDMLASVDPREAAGRDVTLLTDVLDRASQRIQAELSGQPRIAAPLHETIGGTYGTIANYDKARIHLEQSLSLNRRLFGQRSIEAAQSLRLLGAMERDAGLYDTGESLLRESLAITESLLGPKDAETANARNELGLVLKYSGKLDEAESLYRRVLAARIELCGENSLASAAAMNNLGMLLVKTGEFNEARALLTNALAIRRNKLPSNHLDVALSMQNLGTVLNRLGRTDRAITHFQEALAIKQRSHDAAHPSVLKTMQSLSVLYFNTHQFDKCEPLVRDLLQRYQQSQSKDKPAIARVMNSLATLLGATHRFEDSEQWHRRALTMRQEALGDRHPDVAVSLHNLAGMLADWGKLDEAEALYEQALSIRRESLGPHHYLTGLTLNGLAGVAEKRGAYSRAEELMHETLDIWKKSLGKTHDYYLGGLGFLGLTIARGHDPARAEPMLREALALCRNRHGDRNSIVALTSSRLGECLTLLDRFDEAESLLREARAIEESLPGTPLDHRHDTLGRLIRLYEAKGDRDEIVRWRAALADLSAETP